MPVHAAPPELLRTAVVSIINQRACDWELVVVEDPSDSPAGDVLQAFRDDRVRHILNETRTGQLAQRNRTLQEARGEFIAFMDADDVAHPFRLVKQLNFLRLRPEVGVVGCQIAVIDANDRIVGYRQYPVLHEDIFRAARRFVPLCQPSVMMRREVVDMYGGYEWGEVPFALEYALWSRLLKFGVRFANLPEPLLYYRIHDRQIKLSRLHDAIRAVLRIKELYWCDSTDVGATLQRIGERLLLELPPRFVSWMMLRRLYHIGCVNGERIEIECDWTSEVGGGHA
ncbi:MAG: glycosyltransferase [Planctomycetaceae bacterium]